VKDPDGFSRRWHILMKGSIVSAGEGDRGAARAAQDAGRLLLAAEGIAVDQSEAVVMEARQAVAK